MTAAAAKRKKTKPRSLLDSDEPVGFTDAPSRDQSLKLTALGRELLDVEHHMLELERELEKAQKRRHAIRHSELPELMESVGQNKIGLGALEIVLEPFYHASISAEWPEEKRQAAFDYLEARGDGDMIKLQLSYAFRRGELDAARLVQFAMDATVELINKIRGDAGVEQEFVLPEPSLRTEVHHMTLTAWLREQVEAGREVDLEKVGATVGQVAKVKQQKR
jgi:hypothetical protein